VTVRRHVSAVVDKLGVTNRAAAVERFRSLGRPRPPP
jgi:DNA-binding NarL/FixJ family response regulator